MIVVDTNIIGYLYLSGQRSAQVEIAYQKDPHWVAPLLWRSEFSNVLALYLRQRQLSLDEALKIMDEAEGLMAGAEYRLPARQVLALCPQSRCSAYDCEFVALAKDLNVPLVTVDRRILREFPQIAISLDNFIE